MKLTFDQLVDELQDRPSEELAELAKLARQYAIEQRQNEIAENVRKGEEEWYSGKLAASDDIDELMRSLEVWEITAPYKPS